ncbi:MAG: NAD(P)/FAD-dependent oxidoreductase, partial [Alphaproteobacteria bacterium]|nr:NAD(P)/FAD-dependent oxidoreductase [Alphaproteobacteria bacterium]
PWNHPKAISDGGDILAYIKETASENALWPHIRFEHKLLGAAWSSAEAQWTLDVLLGDGSRRHIRCGFLFSCAGYYRHDEGYLPNWPGYADYKGRTVHPQFWSDDVDWTGKRVVIVGSGATAVTLSPVLAEKAAHVWQLQRSPTYMVTRPAVDSLAETLKRWLPDMLAYQLVRWRNILRNRLLIRQMVRDLAGTKQRLVQLAKAQAGASCDVKDLTPDYMPGQQRICRVADGDFFAAMRAGKLTLVTDEIERFDVSGIQLKSGKRLDADIVITATGLVLQALGGAAYEVDGQAIDPAKLMIFKGFMYSNVPNLIYFTGYTNASWTLKVDLVADYACRLLAHMDKTGAKQVTARASEEIFRQPGRANNFISGYVRRAAHRMPKAGQAYPWIHEQNYFWDRKTLLRGKVDDGTLDFSAPKPVVLPPSQRVPDPLPVAAE